MTSTERHDTALTDERRNRLLIDAVADYAIYMLDPDGLLTSWNAGAERFMGYRAADILGRHVSAFFTMEDRAAGLPAHSLKSALTDGRFESKGWRVRQDGSRFWADIVVEPVHDDDGATIGFAEIARDVTKGEELRQALERLRQSQKMEVVGRLAAGVSHDFNNILQVILGGIDILSDETQLSPQARKFMEIIENAAKRGSYLTHHLLAYSRQQALDPKLLTLNELMHSLSSVLSRTLGSNIAVTTAVAANAGMVRADRAMLETALINLAINAAHAMPEGGTLRFEVDSADAALFADLPPGRYLCIAATDSGAGMSPEVLQRAFDPFFTTKGLEGTGLGLAMVQGFCLQSGGNVRATSVPGKGTRFEIWLPEVVASFAPAAPPRANVAGQTGHVLLVDDSPDVLIMMEAFLSSAGFSVHQAFSGQQAIAAFESGLRFDALVTDYMMPGMNGAALIAQARRHQPSLPAVVISGFADVADFMVGLENAALLHKPFQRRDLVAEVARMVARDDRSESRSLSGRIR